MLFQIDPIVSSIVKNNNSIYIYIMDVNLDSVTGIPYSYSYLNNLSINPTIMIILTVVIIGYYLLFASLGVAKGSSMGDAASTAGKGIIYMEVLLWAVFILLLILNGMSYIFNMNVTASIKNLFSSTPEVDIIVDPEDIVGDQTDESTTVPEIKLKKQVFHIPDNKYNYENSKAICQAYGGRLATYKEISDSYDKGSDWCGFGWSDGQMALYPTQYNKWKHLQTIDGHEHDCGRPGINGGYIDNPNVKFGINCYGYKPKITQEESKLMNESSMYPKTQNEINFEKRIDYWRTKIPDILVAPFNNNNWSVI